MKRERLSKSGFVLISLFLAVMMLYIIYENDIKSSIENSGRVVSQIQESPSATPQELTMQLIKLSEDYAKNTGNKKVLNSMISVADERQKTMIALIEEDPSEFLSLAISKDKRDRMPQEIKSKIEEEVSIDSDLEVIHVHIGDFKTGTSRFDYYVTDISGKKLHINSAERESELEGITGDRVNVHGFKLNDQLVLASGSKVGSYAVTASKGGGGGGAKKVAVIAFNYDNNPVQPMSLEDINKMMFTDIDSVNAFHKEESYGKVSLSGRVYGWYTVPYTGNCPAPNNNALQMAKANGLSTNGLYSIIYLHPYDPACYYLGIGTVGSGYTDINGYFGNGYNYVLEHEVGHNLGVYHSHANDCSKDGVRTSIEGTCSNIEYGDVFDVMGSGGSSHMNAFQKAKLGWFGRSNVKTITSGGTFTITPLELPSSGIQTVKFLRDKDPGGYASFDRYYFIEYRKLSGVSIRVAATVSGPFLIDTTPSTNDFSDSVIPVGQTFVDSERGISITVNSISTAGASVTVSMG